MGGAFFLCVRPENFSCSFCGAHAGRESFFQLTHGLRRGLHSYAASRLNPQTSCRALLGPRTSGLGVYGGALLGWLDFSDGDDFGVGAELLIVAVGDVVFDVEVFEQGEAHVDLYVDALRQPDFIVDAGLLDDGARAFVDAGEEEAESNGVEALNVEFLPLRFVFVDPGAEAEFGQDFGFFQVRLVAGPGFGVDDVVVASG